MDTLNHPPVRYRTPPPRQQVQALMPSQPASSSHRPILHLRPKVVHMDPPKQVHTI
jgi:hypothetical protein